MERQERDWGMVELLGQVRLPVCPRLRAAHVKPFYPVDGYCVLDQSPGWFMIPSVEEFRTYCTSAQFDQCPWFKHMQISRAPSQWPLGD